jgi:surfeit locus 1 family protein
MPAGYSFRPRVWALLLAAAACAAGIALGNWQAGRAAEKRAAAAELENRRVSLRGVFRPEHTVLLDNKIRDRRVGYEVVTPLRVVSTTAGDHVLVNRGWIEAGRTREVLPAVNTPAGEVRIEGVALDRLPRVLALESKGKVRQSLDIKAFARETGLRLQPRVVEQHSPADDGLVRDWPRPDAGAEKNAAYAFQWYSLAALAVVIALVLSFRKNAQ